MQNSGLPTTPEPNTGNMPFSGFKTKLGRHKHFLFVLIAVVVTIAATSIYVINTLTSSSQAQYPPGSYVSIPVTEDATISQSKQTKNYGNDNELKVDDDREVFLKFDLPPLVGKPVHKATLRLYITNESKSVQNIREAVSNDWSEATITYSSKPDSGDTVVPFSDTAKHSWKEIDVTTLVVHSIGKTLSLVINASAGNRNNLYFGAKESANPPVIVIGTVPGVPTATNPVTQSPAAIPSTVISQAMPIGVSPTVVPTHSSGIRNVRVTSGPEFRAALDDARPGDAITLADGTYSLKSTSVMVGKQNASSAFRLTKSGTAAQPIVIQGSRNAVLNGDNDYVLHLFNANYVHIKGITAAYGSKGIMLDYSSNNVIDGVEVRDIRMEGIHLRSFSSDNVVKNNYVHHTGIKNGVINDQYGEGIYIGTANSNWGTYTGGKIDVSDRNQILNNVIEYTGGEGIDIKEGTSNGVVQGNTFDNAGIAGGFSDSWVDVKGNSWLITGNKGKNALMDGYQVHGVYRGWGNNNTFTNNTAVSVKQYGFWFQNNVTGNVISCNNTAPSAPAGLANVTCKN